MHENSARQFQVPRPVVVASQLLIFVLICAILYWAKFILVPIALAILCAFVLHPSLRFFERRGVKRALSVGIVLAVALSIVGSLGWIFAKQLHGLLADFPQYRENIKEKIAGVRGMASNNTISGLQETIREVEEELKQEEKQEREVEAQQENATQTETTTPAPPIEETPVPVTVVPQKEGLDFSPQDLGPYLEVALAIALVIVFTGLFLYWREDLVERLVGLAGRARMVVTTNALTDAGTRISRYLGLQFGVNLIYAIVASSGLYFLGVPYAAVWGGFAGLLRYIPYVGSILGTFSATTAALVTLPGWQPALYVFLFYVAMDISVNLAEPFVFGAGLGVSVLAVLVSVIALGWLWGPVGAILATPFAVCLVVLGEYVPGLAFLSWLMSKKPRLRPHSNYYHRLLRRDFSGAAQLLQEGEEGMDSPRATVEAIVAPTIEQAATDRQAGLLPSAEAAWIGEAISDTLDDLVRTNPPPPWPGEHACRLMVCPPVSSLEKAAASALAWTATEVPADLSFNHQGRLVSEVLHDLREEPAQALLLITRGNDRERQVRRWKRHLERAGLETPLLLFDWCTVDADGDVEAENPSEPESELLDAGAAAVLHGLDELVEWSSSCVRQTTAPENSPEPEPVC